MGKPRQDGGSNPPASTRGNYLVNERLIGRCSREKALFGIAMEQTFGIKKIVAKEGQNR